MPLSRLKWKGVTRGTLALSDPVICLARVYKGLGPISLSSRPQIAGPGGRSRIPSSVGSRGSGLAHPDRGRGWTPHAPCPGVWFSLQEWLARPSPASTGPAHWVDLLGHLADSRKPDPHFSAHRSPGMRIRDELRRNIRICCPALTPTPPCGSQAQGDMVGFPRAASIAVLEPTREPNEKHGARFVRLLLRPRGLGTLG